MRIAFAELMVQIQNVCEAVDDRRQARPPPPLLALLIAPLLGSASTFLAPFIGVRDL